MPRIFISYRRDDSQIISGRIHSDLIREFHTHNVFFDRYDIPAGLDFRKYLQSAIQESEVVLVIIGRHWLSITEENSTQRRLDDPEDFVRLEIRTALEANKLIIPVLVDGGMMPRANELSDDIRDFSYRNAISIRHDPDYPRDMHDLVKRIQEPRKTGVTRLFKAESSSASMIGFAFVIVFLLSVIGFFLFKDAFRNPSDSSESTEEIVLLETSTDAPTATIETSPTPEPSATSAPTEAPSETPAPETINLSNIDSIQEASFSPLGHSNFVHTVRYSPDGARIFSGSADGTIKVWDAQTGEVLHTIDFAYVFSLDIDSQGRFLVAAGVENPKVWDLNSYEELKDLYAHNDDIRTVRFSPDGSRLASVDESGVLAIWNTETWTLIESLNIGARAHDLLFPNLPNTVAVDVWDGLIQFWSLSSFNRTQSTVVRDDMALYGMALDPNNPVIAVGAENGGIRLWNYRSNSLETMPNEHSDAVLSLAFNGDGTILLAGDRYGAVFIWDWENRTVLREIDYRSRYNVASDVAVIYSVAFSPDNRSFVVGSRDNLVRIFSLP